MTPRQAPGTDARTSWSRAIAARGVVFSAFLGVLIGIAITKPHINIDRGIVYWLFFLVVSVLLIDTVTIPSSFRIRAKVAVIPTAGLVACLTFKFCLQFMLFAFQGTPFVILGSGIGFGHDYAERQELKAAIGGVHWAIAILEEGTSCKAASDALREATKTRISKALGERALSTECEQVKIFLINHEIPKLELDLEYIEKSIANRPDQPEILLSVSNRHALLVAVAFYGLIAITTPFVLAFLFSIKPDLHRIIGWFRETTSQDLVQFHRKLITIGKIIAACLALLAALL